MSLHLENNLFITKEYTANDSLHCLSVYYSNCIFFFLENRKLENSFDLLLIYGP